MRYLHIGQEPETGYALSEGRSFFSIVVPEASVNFVQNPEPVDLSSYFAIGSPTMTHDLTEQRRGIGSIKVVAAANEGVAYLFPSALPANKHYTASVDVKGPGQIAIFFGTVAGAQVGQAAFFNAPRFWNRQSVTILTPGSTVQSICVVAVEACTFYAGGFQCEAKPYATTFISGSLIAPFDTLPAGQMGYAWMGSSHRAMSYRSADVTNGGRPIPLSDLGLDVTDFMGLGFQAQELVTSRFAFRDRAGFVGVNLADRQFTIGGILKGDGLSSLLAQRGVLGASVVGPERKPIVMQVQLFDDGEPSSEVGEIECVYISGLEGTIGNLYQEKVTINFQAWRPALVVEGNRSKQLDVGLDTTEENIAVLYPDGLMDAIAPPMTDDVPPAIRYMTSNMVIGSDGCLYAGFGLDLMRWNGAEWLPSYTMDPNSDVDSLPTPPDSELLEIKRLGVGPDGRIYLYYRHVCRWDGVDSYFDGFQAYSITSAAIDKLAYSRVVPFIGESISGSLVSMIKDVSWAKPGCIGISGHHIQVGNDNMLEMDGFTPRTVNGWVAFYNTSTLQWDECSHRFNSNEAAGVYPLGDAEVRDFEYDGNKRLWIGGKFWTGTNIKLDIFHYAYGDGLRWTRYGCFAENGDAIGNIRDNARIDALYYDKESDQMYIGGTFDRFHMYTSSGSLTSVPCSPGIAMVRWLVRPLAYSVSGGVIGTLESPWPRVRYIGRQPGGDIYLAGDFIGAMGGDGAGDTKATRIDAGGIVLYNPASDRFVRSPISSYKSDTGVCYYADDIVFSVQLNKWMAGYTTTPAIDYGEFDPTLSSFTARPGTSGAVYVYSANSGWRTSGATEVAVRVGAIAWPRFEVHGPCKMHSIVNATTRRRIVVDRELGAGEMLVIDTLPGHSVIYSSASGVLSSSDAANNCFPDFPLASGPNRLVIVMDRYTNDAACHMTWREEFGSFDGLVKYARG